LQEPRILTGLNALVGGMDWRGRLLVCHHQHSTQRASCSNPQHNPEDQQKILSRNQDGFPLETKQTSTFQESILEANKEFFMLANKEMNDDGQLVGCFGLLE